MDAARLYWATRFPLRSQCDGAKQYRTRCARNWPDAWSTGRSPQLRQAPSSRGRVVKATDSKSVFPSGSVGSSPTGCVDFCPNRTWVGQSRQRHRVAAAAAAAARGSDECEIETVKKKGKKNCPRRGSNSQPRHRSQPLPYKYRALTDCATGALRSNVLHSVLCSST